MSILRDLGGLRGEIPRGSVKVTGVAYRHGHKCITREETPHPPPCGPPSPRGEGGRRRRAGEGSLSTPLDFDGALQRLPDPCASCIHNVNNEDYENILSNNNKMKTKQHKLNDNSTIWPLTRISHHKSGRAGIYRLRKNIPPRIITPAPKAPPLLNQEGSDQRTPLLR